MKKVISLLVVLVISAVSLSACGKERTKTYEGEVNGKQVITSLTYKDDEVLKQSTIATIKYDDLGIDKDEAKQMFKNDEQAFKGIEGVTYKTDYKDADIDQLKKNLGFISSDAKKGDHVSVDRVVKQLKRNGLKDKSKMNEDN